MAHRAGNFHTDVTTSLMEAGRILTDSRLVQGGFYGYVLGIGKLMVILRFIVSPIH